MSAEHISYSAWHPLLVRSLRSALCVYEHGKGPRVPILLSILARLPVPRESTVAVEKTTSILRDFILNLSLRDVLRCTEDVTRSTVQDDINLSIRTYQAPNKKSRTPKKRRSKVRSLVGGKDLQEFDSETDKAHYRGVRSVHVHECVLQSDSDGFAAFAGDIPPAGPETDRDHIDDNTTYIMYQSLYGTFPTLISQLEVLCHAIVVFSRFSIVSSLPTGIKLLSDVLMREPELSIDDDIISPTICRMWLNWLQVVHLSCRCLTTLTQMSSNVVGYDYQQVVDQSINNMFYHIRKNVDAVIKLSPTGILPSLDSVCIAVVDDALRLCNSVSLAIFDYMLTLVNTSNNKHFFTSIGECLVAWALDPSFSTLLPSIVASIVKNLHINDCDQKDAIRFTFELFASLLDSVEVTEYLLRWALVLPCGFHQTVTGVELLSVLTPHLSMYASLVASVLRRHLPVMMWSSSSRTSSFSTSTVSVGTASGAVTILAGKLLAMGRTDVLVQLCTIVLPHCDPFDCEYLLVNTVIPSIVQICSSVDFKESETENVSSTTCEMSKPMKDLLKELELLAAHLKTPDAAVEVIQKIVVPRRDFYFSASELQDVFVAVCSKATRLASHAAIESGLCEWLVDRLTSCLKHASTDVWVLMEDSAAKYSKLLLSMLNIIGDVTEENKDVFSKYRDRLLSSTSSLVDVCFEWMGSPSDNYRSAWRVTEVMSKSLSIHLLMVSDSDDVCSRFCQAIVKILQSSTSSTLQSCVVCSLLDRCLSRHPTVVGSIMSIDQNSEDDVLLGETAPVVTIPRRTVIHPGLVPSVIELTTSFLKVKTTIDDVLDFMVMKMYKQLQIIDKHGESGPSWLCQLFDLRDVLVSLEASDSVLCAVYNLLTMFIKRHPRSQDIHRFVCTFFVSEKYKNCVLRALLALISAEPIRPSHCLVFPQQALNQPVEIRSEAEIAAEAERIREEELEKSNSSRVILNAVEKFLLQYRSDGETESERRKARKKHLKDQVRVRSSASISMERTEPPKESNEEEKNICLNGGAAWFTLAESHAIYASDGLTLSFWLRRELVSKLATTAPPLHLLTLGGHSLICSCSLTARGKIVVDVTVDNIKLARIRLRGTVIEKNWSHIVLGMRVNHENVQLQATVGDLSTSTSIPLLVKLDSISFPLSISFGCIKKRSHHNYYLSTIFGFKGLLSPSCILTLSGLGCQISSLAETQTDSLVPNLAPAITYKMVSTRQHVLESVQADLSKFIQRLQRALVFVIKSNSADSYGVSILPPGIEPTNFVGKSPLSMAQLKDYPINWTTRLAQMVNSSVDAEMIPLGGIKFIVYLYIKSVNDALPKETQLLALEILLTCLRRGSFHTADAERLNVGKIITRTLSSRLAVCDDDCVEMLLKYCIEWNATNDHLDISVDSVVSVRLDPYQAVLREPKFLVLLCCHSELWRGDRFSVWRHLVAAVASIVDPVSCQTPCTFNKLQLGAADMLPKFLHCILQMIQSPEHFPDFHFEASFVRDVVAIVEALLGAPESVVTVGNLWHFIFLSHPASFTYIDHRVQGHCAWLTPEFIRDEGEGELLGDSKLCRQLKKYLQVLGKDVIAEKWQKGCSPYEIRRSFESAATSFDGRGDDARLPTMPDLISDIVNLNRGDSADSLDDSLYCTIKEPVEKTDPAWVLGLRASLMTVLSNVLQNGADSLLACIQHDVMSWHAIIVLLTHQSDPAIREGAVDLLQKFLLRAPTFTRIAFLRLSGFHMLGSQLRGHPVTMAVADNLFSMMLGETIRLGDGLDQSHLYNMTVDNFSCESIYAILIAFEESVPDGPLFWNITNSLMKTFENNSQLQQAMVDGGLVDAMVNTLRRIAYLPPVVSCEIVMDKPVSSIQLECWTLFAQRIIMAAIPYNDELLNNACERFIWLLMLADVQAVRDARFTSADNLRAQKTIRSQLCQLLHCWIESIRTVFSEEGRSASATSSVDSLYNPGTSSSSSPSEDFDYCEDIPPDKPNLLEGTAAFIAGSYVNLREKINHLGPISRRTLRCQYHKRVGPAPLATIDSLTKRILFSLDMISSVFAILIPTESVTEQEENLFHFYLYFLLSCWKKENQPVRGVALSVWNRLVVLFRDRSRVLLAQLVAFVLFPAHRKIYETALATRSDIKAMPNWQSDWVEEKRRQIIKALAHELQYKQTLSSLLSVNLDYEYALCLGLYEMAFVSPMKPEIEEEIERMVRFLNNSKVGSSLDQFSSDSLNNLNTDEILSMHSYSQFRKTIMSQMRSRMETIIDEEAKMTSHVSEMSMAVTCEVVEEQNIPRKEFIKATKTSICEFVEAENVMLNISKELCHPESSAFEQRHWPVGWALDPTEGPMRERRRMMPCYYTFEPKFFLDDKKKQVEQNLEVAPLHNLLSFPISERSALEKAQIHEPIRLFLEVTVLRGTFECRGELIVAETALHFVGDSAKTTQKETACSVITLSWKFEQLAEIQMRYHLLKDTALELFITNGDTYLIVFQSIQKRNEFKCQLVECQLEHLFPNTEQLVLSVVQAWRHGTISNFEYLMHMNKLAGRSFNDLMQYPVFPFILADYSSAVLDLGNPTSFRNLSRPMAIQDKRMESHYIATYNCLQSECSRMSSENGPLHFGPYHYGSHYSNSGIVVHYLVRLCPFTQIALEYQDNSFDIPDRLFNSIEATWRLSSSESTTDFKELVPEFYCLPEFLQNREQLCLGVRQGGEVVGDVRLPVWTSGGNARLFVLIHRQALESNIVTQNLHSWVDLIFGFKQTGKAALEALNVFHPATYRGHLNADELEDELSQSALRTMVRSYGQMPNQILQTPHLPHLAAGKEKKDKEKPPAPIPTVRGVRWGDYVGSPEQETNQIQVVLSVKFQGLKSDRLGRVMTLPDGTAAGIPQKTVIVTHSTLELPKDPISKTRRIDYMAALSFSFTDSMLRFRYIKPEVYPWMNVMEIGNTEISCIEYSETNKLLFVSFTSGLIRVFKLELGPDGELHLTQLSDMLGHHSPINILAVSDEFSVAVSGDQDGNVIVWDVNRLSFVRVLRRSSSAVTALCISSVTADVAVVCQQGYGSRVELFTINGDVVGHIETESTVTCVAMTNQKDGTSINCVALGMLNGHIRLCEMWCLSTVREIFHDNHLEPIISIEYACNGKKLYVVLASGRVLCWQVANTMSRSKSQAQFTFINPNDLT